MGGRRDPISGLRGRGWKDCRIPRFARAPPTARRSCDSSRLRRPTRRRPRGAHNGGRRLSVPRVPRGTTGNHHHRRSQRECPPNVGGLWRGNGSPEIHGLDANAAAHSVRRRLRPGEVPTTGARAATAALVESTGPADSQVRHAPYAPNGAAHERRAAHASSTARARSRCDAVLPVLSRLRRAISRLALPRNGGGQEPGHARALARTQQPRSGRRVVRLLPARRCLAGHASCCAERGGRGRTRPSPPPRLCERVRRGVRAARAAPPGGTDRAKMHLQLRRRRPDPCESASNPGRALIESVSPRTPGRRIMDGASHGVVLMTAAADIREKLVRIYCSLSPGGRPPPDGERGELDSMAFLEFILLIEREFGIVVETTDLEEANFATTTATTTFVQHKLNGRHP